MNIHNISVFAVKLLLSVTIGLLIGGFAAFYFSPRAAKPTQPPGLGSIVRLVQDGRTFCSGTVVNETTVITAGHCAIVERLFGMGINPEPIEIRAKDNVSRSTFGKVHSLSVQLDTAVLKGNFKIYAPRDFISNVQKLDEMRNKTTEFVACGYPLDGNLHCSKVYYRTLQDFCWRVRGLIIPGMSGGPVIAPNGSVVAINHAVYNEDSLVCPIYNIDRGF